MAVDILKLVEAYARDAAEYELRAGGKMIYNYEKTVEILAGRLANSTFVDQDLLFDKPVTGIEPKNIVVMMKHARYLANALFDHDDGYSTQPTEEEREMSFARNDMVFVIANGMIVRGTVTNITTSSIMSIPNKYDVEVQVSHEENPITLEYVKESRLSHTMEGAYESFKGL
ncbi:hypothetical protein KAR91_19520 [Candidatus Pacearchaeota archaeon]|nr:hypothetical protein [Candidatus Pacearchaeota archaeon]